MLKMVLRSGETLSIGENVKIVVTQTSASRAQVVIDAPREIKIAHEKEPAKAER